MDALSTYRIWTPPNSYPLSSAMSSPSKSTVPHSESEHEKNPGNRGTHPTGSTRISPSTGPLWYGEEQWLVIFHAGGKQWKLPHNPFSQKSCHLHEFLNSGPFSNSAYFDQDVDAESGLPLIELLQVESAEGEAFLMALYNSDFFERPFVSDESASLISTSLDTVLAVLKLSTRYEVQFLRKRALAHLSHAYPTSLDLWDRRGSRSNFPLTSAGSDANSLYYATPTETLRVIKIAQECDALWILPSALYECCKYNLESIYRHSMFVDDTIDADLQLKILVGFTEQKDLTMIEVLDFLRIPIAVARQAGCSPATLTKCADARMETEKTVLAWTLQWPLELWSEHSWDDEMTRDMCRACKRTCKEALEEGRKRAWERLPEIFRLPNWKRLEELMEEAKF